MDDAVLTALPALDIPLVLTPSALGPLRRASKLSCPDVVPDCCWSGGAGETRGGAAAGAGTEATGAICISGGSATRGVGASTWTWWRCVRWYSGDVRAMPVVTVTARLRFRTCVACDSIGWELAGETDAPEPPVTGGVGRGMVAEGLVRRASMRAFCCCLSVSAERT